MHRVPINEKMLIQSLILVAHIWCLWVKRVMVKKVVFRNLFEEDNFDIIVNF